jgi:hypothetical protein
VVAAREGDLESALTYGERALSGDRRSLPSLLMVSRELGTIVQDRYSSDPEATEYLDHLRQLRESAA